MIMRRSPRNVKISCNHTGLSHFAGSYFFQEFLRVLHLRYFLAEQIRYPRRNRDYSVSQMLLALVYPILLGWIASRRRPCYVRTERFSI